MSKPRQPRLPGVVPKEIEEIEDKAEEVRNLQADRMDIQQRETKAREDLLELMKKHKCKEYPLTIDDEEYEVVIESSVQKAFVRKKKGQKKEKTEKGDADLDDTAKPEGEAAE